MTTPVEILSPRTAADHEAVKALFREYAESLGFSLAYQDFETELAGFPGKYAPPEGALLLATADGEAAGTVALRKLEQGICEMKRLYVRPAARGSSLGRRLAERICDEARAAGYARICLDTLSTMTPALKLYASLGFRDIEPYVFNPIPGARFLALELQPEK